MVFRLISYCKKKLKMLLDSQVTPILIFDGAKLVMKGNTEDERERNREEHKKKAEEYLKQGNSVMAHKMFASAVDITPELAHAFVEAAKSLNVEYYVAPYEADAQLAFMYFSGRAQVIITEDSDLLAFGVKRCFFKMDKFGFGFEVNLDELAEVQELNFRMFTPDMLLVTCILSGCDYLESIKGIGFKKAHKLVYENGKEVRTVLKKIRREGRHLIPMSYENTFEKALLTFKFQLVYDPEAQKLVHLNDPEKNEHGPLLKNHDNLDFLGKYIDAPTAKQIALCEIDPISHVKFTDIIEEKKQAQKKEGT